MALTLLFSPRGTFPPERAEGGALRGDKKNPLRRCLVTGEDKPKDLLIRFVAGPQKTVLPDLSGKLPGRGLWVSASREALDLAVRKNLFSKAAKTKLSVEASLSDQVAALLRKRCASLLGLARSAGLVILGETQILSRLKDKKLSFVLLASDAGADIVKKTTSVSRIVSPFSREELGEALGRGGAAALGLCEGPLSKKLLSELARFRGLCVSLDHQPDTAPDLLSRKCEEP